MLNLLKIKMFNVTNVFNEYLHDFGEINNDCTQME